MNPEGRYHLSQNPSVLTFARVRISCNFPRVLLSKKQKTKKNKNKKMDGNLNAFLKRVALLEIVF